MNGDLIVEVTIVESTQFYLDNKGLHTIMQVDAVDAMLGVETNVKVFDRAYKFAVPGGIQNGQSLRMKGKGWPVFGQTEERGDLYVNVIITVPNDLTEEEVRALTKVRNHINERRKKGQDQPPT